MESVLITGAAKRLGSLIAADLASAGCFVWIHYRTHETEAAALKASVLASGGNAECVQADLTKTEEIDRMLSVISSSEYGKLTALINNASLFAEGRLGNTAPDEWDRVMDTNLKAVWYLSARFTETFPTARRIITIGDASASKGYANHAVYGLSKYALKYLTEQMAVEYAPRVSVNLLSPGYVLQGENEPDAVWEKRANSTLTGNADIVESVLKGVRFLMSDPGLTGSELMIDNGVHLPDRKPYMTQNKDII